MRTKILEIRDRGTYIAALAVEMSTVDPTESYYLRREGYSLTCPVPSVLLTRLSGEALANVDPYSWNDRTMKAAHDFIIDNFADLSSGDVVDVEHILGETEVQKISERLAL